MDQQTDRRLGLVHSALVLGAAFLVLGWLYLLLLGVEGAAAPERVSAAHPAVRPEHVAGAILLFDYLKGFDRLSPNRSC